MKTLESLLAVVESCYKSLAILPEKMKITLAKFDNPRKLIRSCTS